jgi:hypothetical protein
MPGVALDEAVGCDNPLLQFFYQSNGRMADVAELKFSIRDVPNQANRITDQTVNVTDDCGSGGQRLGLGRYAAAFTPTAPTWKVGTHEIAWKFKAAATDPERSWRQRFELLDPVDFPTGQGFRAYTDSAVLRESSDFSACSYTQLHRTLLEVAERIDRLTGNIFEPRFIDTRYNTTNAGALPFYHPIIGISKVDFVAGGPAESLLSIDLDDLLIYNRHIASGLLEPDDRQNPRIEFATSHMPGEPSFQGQFLYGRQSVAIAGVFGYTEFDGGPIGRRPLLLERAANILSGRLLSDPFGVDVFMSSPGRVRSARTRDQAVTYGGASEGAVGALTGDRIIDDLLLPMRRPSYLGAMGAVSIQRSSRMTG